MASVLQPMDISAVGGLDPLIDIINRSDRATERLIVEGLQARDPELAEEVKSRMFMFEDITMLEDRDVQLVLRQVEAADLALALKGVSDEVRDKITTNMSERAPREPARGHRPARPGAAAARSRRPSRRSSWSSAARGRGRDRAPRGER